MTASQVAGHAIHVLLLSFLICMFVRFVVDWVQVLSRGWQPRGPLLVVLEVVYSITDPPINVVRRAVPPLRVGQVALDMGFMIVMIVAYALLQINARVLL